mgnify:CR=1 FL=1
MSHLEDKLLAYLVQKTRDDAKGICGPGLQISESEVGQILRLLRGWESIETAPKDGTFIWLSDGFFMRIGYWYVVTKDPSQEHWADMALAEAHEKASLQWKPTHWQPMPKPPGAKL